MTVRRAVKDWYRNLIDGNMYFMYSSWYLNLFASLVYWDGYMYCKYKVFIQTLLLLSSQSCQSQRDNIITLLQQSLIITSNFIIKAKIYNDRSGWLLRPIVLWTHYRILVQCHLSPGRRGGQPYFFIVTHKNVTIRWRNSTAQCTYRLDWLTSSATFIHYVLEWRTVACPATLSLFFCFSIVVVDVRPH